MLTGQSYGLQCGTLYLLLDLYTSHEVQVESFCIEAIILIITIGLLIGVVKIYGVLSTLRDTFICSAGRVAM